MLDISVPALTIHQYGLSDNQDVLYLFSAPAKVLAQWAGVPRKGWHIRMLYQRWVTPSRRRELADFWNRAGRPNEALGQSVILGPTAIVLAIQDKSISVENGKLHLRYTPPIDLADDAINNLKRGSSPNSVGSELNSEVDAGCTVAAGSQGQARFAHRSADAARPWTALHHRAAWPLGLL